MNIFGKPPHRTERIGDNQVRISVEDPYSRTDAWNSTILDNDQFARYEQWMNGGILIQHALYDLSPDQRELLISGTSAEDFNRMIA